MPTNDRVDGLRAAFARVGLPAWFVVIDLLWVAKPAVLGVDARHYQRAASVWLAGAIRGPSPRRASRIAAGPHTLLFYAPTSWLPIGVSMSLWFVIGLAASIWLVRSLAIATVVAVLSAARARNLERQPADSHARAARRGYIHRRRAGSRGQALRGPAVGVPPASPGVRAVVVLAVNAAVPALAGLPRRRVLQSGSRLTTAWNGSAWRVPWLLPPTLLALWVLRRRGGEWFAVPAVFPATQFYYVSTALPALVDRRFIAAILALPVPLLTPLVVIGLAIAPWVREHLERRGSRVPQAPAGSTPT